MELQHKSPWHSSNIWIIDGIHSNNFSSNQSIAFKACGGEPLASSLDAIGTNQILFLNEARIHSFHSSMLLIVYCVITAYHLVVVSTTAHQACPQTTTNVYIYSCTIFVPSSSSKADLPHPFLLSVTSHPLQYFNNRSSKLGPPNMN